MKDFFVSYTKADEGWAAWIGWTLEENGFSVVMQAWDFRAGRNFVLEMQRAASQAERTIAVLSPDYLNSQFTTPEWAAAFADDPEGLKRRLIPVRVRECRLTGLWKAIIHIDLVGLEKESAEQHLLDGIRGTRGKPRHRPQFPGAPASHSARTQVPSFPGRANRRDPFVPLPKLRTPHTDRDRQKFLREAFGEIAHCFERSLSALAEQYPDIDYEFNRDTASQFSVQVFIQGNLRAQCKIWIMHQLGDGIAYYEGRDLEGNAMNEFLGISEHEGELVLSAQMNYFTFGRIKENLNLDHLSLEHAAEYLWRRMISNLS